jgi:outer membrane protein
MSRIMAFVTAALAACLILSANSANAEESVALTLQDCIDIALKQSPLIRSSGLDVDASKESVKISRGSLFPRVDLNGVYMKENQPVPYIPAQSMTIPAKFSDEVYSWGFYLRMPVYEGGRLRRQVDISKIEEDIQSSRQIFTIEDVIANVTNTFNKLLQLRELKQAQEISVEALERQKQNTELFVKAGRAARVEFLRVDVQLASDRQDLIRTLEAIKRTKETLAFFMGVPRDQVRNVSGVLQAEEKISTADIDKLLRTRPDVVAASKKVDQARMEIDRASGKRYPSVALVGDYGDRAGSGFRGREEVWEAGVVLSINVFDGGIISAEVRREKVLLRKAEEELRLIELRARLEADNAVSSLKEAEARVGVAKKAVAQSEESLRIEELKYKTGAGTITDALLAESAMSAAQANYYQALYDYNAAIMEFKKSTGTIEVKL